jgi:hypothetical protein
MKKTKGSQIISLYFSFYLLLLSLYIIIYIYIYIYKPSFDVKSAQNCDTCSCFLIQMYKNVYLDSLLVRQLNHRDFICNALNCLNEENKRSSNCLSLYNFLFIFSCFMFNWLNEKNKRFTNYLFIFLFYFDNNCSRILLFNYISYIYIKAESLSKLP